MIPSFLKITSEDSLINSSKYKQGSFGLSFSIKKLIIVFLAS